jgi:nitroreductase
LFADVDQGLTGGIAAAPVLIVVGGDTRLVRSAWLATSLFPAIQNLLLAANALGLGSALTTLATARAADVSAIVDFPPEIEPVAVVPLGFPARPLAPPRRLPVADKAWRERYGEPW